MEQLPSLIISHDDFHKILSVLSLARTDLADQLEEEITRATLVPSGRLPPNIVAMHSTVTFVDLDSGKEQRVTLVYPREASVDEGKISILTPVGAALIGLRVGQQIEWPIPPKKVKRIKVLAVEPPPR